MVDKTKKIGPKMQKKLNHPLKLFAAKYSSGPQQGVPIAVEESFAVS